jgi:hypothetical protein
MGLFQRFRRRSENLSEGACVLLQPSGIASGLSDLVTDATRAAQNLLLDRSLALSDRELILLVNALRNCGMLSDHSGNLLPDLISRLHQVVFLENDNPAQFHRLLAVIHLQKVQVCIHGRSILADALQSLAELIRANNADSILAVRHLLHNTSDRAAYPKLIETCCSFRAFVKDAERTSINPPPGDEVWAFRFYEPIATFEAFGQEALLMCHPTPGA